MLIDAEDAVKLFFSNASFEMVFLKLLQMHLMPMRRILKLILILQTFKILKKDLLYQSRIMEMALQRRTLKIFAKQERKKIKNIRVLDELFI